MILNEFNFTTKKMNSEVIIKTSENELKKKT